MSNCKISIKKFKEFQLADKNGNLTPDNNSHHHENQDELFLVGYQYQDENDCPEIKMRLSEIMSGSGGEGGGGGTGGYENGDLLNYLGDVLVSFTNNDFVGYGSWSWNDEHNNYQLMLLMPKAIRYVDIKYDADPDAYGNFDLNSKTLYLHLLPNGGGGGGDILPIDSYIPINQAPDNTPHGEYDSSTNTLTLYLQPGPSGQNGQDGQDGTTVTVYKAVLTNITPQAPSGNANQNMYYILNSNSISWSVFNPATGTYSSVNAAPVPTSDQLVEIGPADSTPLDISKNLRYGTFGKYDSNQFHFYSVAEPDANDTITYSVKIYSNLATASSNNSNSNSSQS